MYIRSMVALFSLLLIFNTISCDKKSELDHADGGKKTEVVEEDEEGAGQNEEEEGPGQPNEEEEDPGQPNEEEEDPGQPNEEEEDPNFNYDEFQVNKGYHVPFPLGDTPSPFGYYVFFPESYKKIKNHYPILIVLHGSGERGNSQANRSELGKVLKHGPGKLIKNKTWNPPEEMLVVSPQTTVNRWESGEIRKLIDYLTDTYRIDERRIYLTGLSLGGSGIFDYIGRYGAESKIAAVVPICGRNKSDNQAYVANVAKVPLWIFHGEADPQVDVSYSLQMSEALNSINAKPKLTLFPNVGHDSWTMTYDGSGQGKEDPNYDAFDQNIYSWLLQHQLP